MQGPRDIHLDALVEVAAQISIGLAETEGQLRAIDLAELAHRPPTPQQQRGRRPAGQDDVQVLRRPFDQRLHQLADTRVGGVLEVVDDQVKVAIDPGQAVDQQRQEGLLLVFRHLLAKQQRAFQCHVHLLQGAHQVGAERFQLAFVRRQRQPSHRRAGLDQRLPPLPHQRRLAEPRAARHQEQAAIARLVQAFQQLLAQDAVATDPWRRELGADQQGGSAHLNS
ncbi:hypothetical protein D9M68_604390 [compost metagenome]